MKQVRVSNGKICDAIFCLHSGGTEVEVKGTELNSVFNPRLVVHVGNPTRVTEVCAQIMKITLFCHIQLIIQYYNLRT